MIEFRILATFSQGKKCYYNTNGKYSGREKHAMMFSRKRDAADLIEILMKDAPAIVAMQIQIRVSNDWFYVNDFELLVKSVNNLRSV